MLAFLQFNAIIYNPVIFLPTFYSMLITGHNIMVCNLELHAIAIKRCFGMRQSHATTGIKQFHEFDFKCGELKSYGGEIVFIKWFSKLTSILKKFESKTQKNCSTGLFTNTCSCKINGTPRLVFHFKKELLQKGTSKKIIQRLIKIIQRVLIQ